MGTTTQRFQMNEEADGHTNGITVLIVDDHPWIGELIALGLGGLGLRTVTASDGREAREVLQQHGIANIDLLITEQDLPDLDGKKLMTWFLRENPRGQVILMSSFPEEADLCERAAFLRKPFRHDELIARVDELLAESGVVSLQNSGAIFETKPACVKPRASL